MKNLQVYEQHLKSIQEKNWIASATEGGKGKLRKQLGIGKDETLTKSRVKKEINKLEDQDTDSETEGTQLPPAKAKKFKRLHLAKNLMKLGEGRIEGIKNYMFFQNLSVICDMCTEILEMDPMKVDAVLEDDHAWAVDHIATSKDDVDEVWEFLTTEMKRGESQMSPSTTSSENPEVVITDNENC